MRLRMAVWKGKKMHKVYMLNQKKDKGCNAAGKAMRDVFTVFGRLGMRVIPGVPKDAGRLLKVLDLPLLAGFALLCAGKKDGIIYSYPENKLKIRLLCALRKIKGYKVVCFINDLNSIRGGKWIKTAVSEELSYVGCADIILAPNENTVKFLDLQGVKSRMIPVGAWDYLLSEDETVPYKKHEEGVWRIAFAGNLDKAAFLFELGEVADEQVCYELWGNISKDVKSLPENTVYHEPVAPEALPKEMAGCHFGLVWDGISTATCDGGLGIYLRYNNSHKCGLYLASGMPVFVWKQSGLMHFVEENGCGYGVESLSEINEILRGMTAEEYERVIENTKRVAKVLREGGLLERAYRKMRDIEG